MITDDKNSKIELVRKNKIRETKLEKVNQGKILKGVLIMANFAYKMRIYPSIEQIIMLKKTFGCVRFIYNKMLECKIKYYEENHKMLHNTPAQYKSDFPFLKEVDSLALANAQLHLEASFKNLIE